MALSRRAGNRFQGAIWPGFVDAMTGLLLVLMFVLTIFMVVQFVLREEISGQATELDALSAEVSALSLALGLEQDRSASLEDRVGALTETLGDARARQEEQALRIETLRARNTAQAEALQTARGRITGFEDQVAGLRDEVDAQEEAARLAAARREALAALVADLRARNLEATEAQAALTELGVDNVIVQTGPLTDGAAEHGPYDVIMLQGAVEDLPVTITDQLKDGGRMAVLFQEGRLGVVRIGYKSDGRISWRFSFNAGAPVLPGFGRVASFSL